MMDKELSGKEASAGEWAFYWAPPWKGAAWLALYLVVYFSYLQLWGRLTDGGANKLSGWAWYLAFVFSPVIWLSALLCWMSMRKKDWQDVGGDANSRRIAFLKTYLPEAGSLIALIYVTWFAGGMFRFYVGHSWGQMTRMGVFSWGFLLSLAFSPLSNAVIAGMSIPMFTYLAVTRLPSGRKGITGLIVAGLLANVMFNLLASKFWGLATPLLRRMAFGGSFGFILLIAIQQLTALLLVGGLGLFAVKHVNVNVFKARE